MRRFKIILHLSIFMTLLVTASSCMRQPESGRIIHCGDHGVTITLMPGWEGEVHDLDWHAFKRNRKGRDDFKWVFPPITSRNIPVSEVEHTSKFIKWRFKGVEGAFDNGMSPLSRECPMLPGLWTMPPEKVEVLYSTKVILEWPGLSGTEATTRLYRHTRGMGDLDAFWLSYIVTFNHGPNAYEFVMLIPSSESDQVYIDSFWGSIENVSIELVD